MYIYIMRNKNTHVFLDRLEREGVIDSVLTSPLESGPEFLDTIGRVPL